MMRILQMMIMISFHTFLYPWECMSLGKSEREGKSFFYEIRAATSMTDGTAWLKKTVNTTKRQRSAWVINYIDTRSISLCCRYSIRYYQVFIFLHHVMIIIALVESSTNKISHHYHHNIRVCHFFYLFDT